METTNDKLEQQKDQSQKLTDDELDQTTGGSRWAPKTEQQAPPGPFL